MISNREYNIEHVKELQARFEEFLMMLPPDVYLFPEIIVAFMSAIFSHAWEQSNKSTKVVGT